MELWFILVVLDENGFVYLAGDVNWLEEKEDWNGLMLQLPELTKER